MAVAREECTFSFFPVVTLKFKVLSSSEIDIAFVQTLQLTIVCHPSIISKEDVRFIGKDIILNKLNRFKLLMNSG